LQPGITPKLIFLYFTNIVFRRCLRFLGMKKNANSSEKKTFIMNLLKNFNLMYVSSYDRTHYSLIMPFLILIFPISLKCEQSQLSETSTT